MTETERPIQFVTNACRPDRSNVTPSGCRREPRSMGLVTAPLPPLAFGSMTVTVPPGGFWPAAGAAERVLATEMRAPLGRAPYAIPADPLTPPKSFAGVS